MARAASKASSASESRSRSSLLRCCGHGSSIGVLCGPPVRMRKREKVVNVPNPRNFPVRPHVCRVALARLVVTACCIWRRSFPWTVSSISSDWSSSSCLSCRSSACGEAMTIIEPAPTEPRAVARPPLSGWTLEWSPIVLGALTASAVSSILVTFGAAVGLGVSSASPTWRDASVALWLLSGIFLVLQALLSFACGGYLAGRTRSPYAAAAAEDVERRDGLHGIASWALAVLIGAIVIALVGMAANRPTALTAPGDHVRTVRLELRARPSVPRTAAIAQRGNRGGPG